MQKSTRSILLILTVFYSGIVVATCNAQGTKTIKAPPKLQLHINIDHPDGMYKIDETVQFTITATRGKTEIQAGKIVYVIDDFGPNQIKKGMLPLSSDPQVITGKLTTPGFLRCRVSYRPKTGKVVSAIAGAAVAPLTIQPSLETPKDFDIFWKLQKEKLASIKMLSKLTPVKSSDKKVDLFDVQITSLGAPVSGYLAKPKNAKPKSLPIVLWVHGAGVRSSGLGTAATGAKRGLISMDINAHGIPNGKPAKFYSDLRQGALKGYPHRGREDRDKVYFKEMFLRMVRAIDFLTAQPEWDGKTVCVVGHSQGGAQALVAGGLDDRVTFIGTGVPAMCDHTGAAVSRVSGWPKFVPKDSKGQADLKITQVSQYYDAVNFAKRCKAEAIMSVGFCDNTCPPTSCYAAYNQLSGNKQIINKIQMGHAAPRDVQKKFFAALLKHAKKTK